MHDLKEITDRDIILELEKEMLTMDNVTKGNMPECPLTHRFADGFYIRSIKIPKGTLIVSRIHKHQHPVFVEQGTAVVFSETNGQEVIEAPKTIISESGTKRVLYSLTDLVWTTLHLNPTNERDIETLEKMNVADTFDEYNTFLESKKTLSRRLRNNIIKKLL